MTSDDLDKWLVLLSQFVGADFESGISFALNNVPEAQDSCKDSKITVEMGYGNHPWQRDLA